MKLPFLLNITEICPSLLLCNIREIISASWEARGGDFSALNRGIQRLNVSKDPRSVSDGFL